MRIYCANCGDCVGERIALESGQPGVRISLKVRTGQRRSYDVAGEVLSVTCDRCRHVGAPSDTPQDRTKTSVNVGI